MIRVSFITSTDPSLGSYRYRIQAPVRLLAEEHGYFADIKRWPDGSENVAIFSKHFNYLDYQYANLVKASGGSVIFDICDNHVGDNLWGHYERMIDIADVIVFSSQTLKEHLEPYCGEKPKFTISDPPLLKPLPPKRSVPALRPNMLWFGQAQSLHALEPHIETLPPGNLTIISNRFPDWLDKFKGHIQPYEWSEETFARCMEECDLVLLPQFLNDAGMCKSGNRLFEAIRSNRMAVASPVPIYKEFEDFIFVGDNIGDLVGDFMRTPVDAMHRRLANANEYMETHYGPAEVKKLWTWAIETAIG